MISMGLRTSLGASFGSRSSWIALFGTLSIAACGGSGAAVKMLPAPDAGVEDTDQGPTGLLAVPRYGVQVATEPLMMAPGREVTHCYHVNLHNPEPIDVVRFQTAGRAGLHHFNVFASTLDRADGWGPCPNSVDLFVGARPILDGSGSAVDYRFPDGLALRLEPNTLIIVQAHFINASTAPLMAQFVTSFHRSPSPATQLVDVYGFTTFDITLPPRKQTTITKDCLMSDRIHLLTMSTHFHARGIRATGSLIRRDSTSPMQLYETESWSEPRVLKFAPAMYVTEGDTIRFECAYDNKGDTTVRYGPSANDEMCFLFGYYYPKVGLIPCF